MNSQHFTVQGDGQHNALELLDQECQLTKAEIKDCALKGAVWLSQHHQGKISKPKRIRRLKKVLKNSEQLELYYNPQVLQQTPPNATLVTDKQSYSIWIKPRGMLSQGSKWADFSALYRWSELYFQSQGDNRQSWIVHRLDKMTHGLMIVAHSKSTARYFTQAFEEGNIHKRYQCNVRGNANNLFSEEESLHLQQTNTQRLNATTLQIRQPLEGKNACTDIQQLSFNPQHSCSRLLIDLHTGRKHQIRQHLAILGYPILGDRLYGDTDSATDLQLTAFALQWTCPLDQSVQKLELSTEQLDLVAC